MFVYAINRSALAAGIVMMTIFLLVCTINFIPGDPAAAIMGPRATPELRAMIEARLGLDKPLLQQYFHFLANTLQGDLGTDIRSERPITAIIFENLPYTLILIVLSMFWSVTLGLFLGIVAAVHRNSTADKIIGILSAATISTPSFVVALFALLLFSVNYNLLPAIGAGEPGNIRDQLLHLILPAFALGLSWVGYIARLLRSSLIEVLRENFIRTARSYGLPAWKVHYVYALKIAILPVVSILGVGIGTMISGAVFVEIVFARPGLGSMIYESVVTRNYPVLLGGVLTTTVLFVLTTLAADLTNAALDPRIRNEL
ncbi:MAG: ABC transporter permease [Xanthomonadales bacterium]|nr:ABC transporter permease [Xanthomonadales bacterium]